MIRRIAVSCSQYAPRLDLEHRLLDDDDHNDVADGDDDVANHDDVDHRKHDEGSHRGLSPR
jgi:hypothetical protein